MKAEVSFLPEEMVPVQPEFFVWWTGTLGQAEWLISHSKILKGKAVAKECSKDLSTLPEKIRPLMALEQPDLLVTTSKLKALISIEITEQQEFGLNAQQRVARFWSAVANKIPSAYLLPIESYQIEKASISDINIFKEKNSKKKKFLEYIATIPGVQGNQIWESGITDFDSYLNKIEKGEITIDGEVRNFLRKHIKQDGAAIHIKNIDGKEYVHQVGSNLYKVYIRTPKVTSSMLLSWFLKCSKEIPTYTFKLHSMYENIFRTKGLVHTVEDRENPHLSFRNLPPAPGVLPVIHKSQKKDEISLFFQMVDNACAELPIGELGRDLFAMEDEYFPKNIQTKWRRDVTNISEILASKGEDIRISGTIFKNLMSQLNIENGFDPNVIAINFQYNMYKIQCNAEKRGLGDPYTGALAIRDVLFCRQSEKSLKQLSNFDRDEGLVFWVNLGGKAAEGHTFLYKALNSNYKRILPNGKSKVPMDQLIELTKFARAEQLTKDIRSHLIFCDYIVVSRNLGNSKKIEFLPGIPSLIRMKLIQTENKLIQSLKLP